MWYTLRALPDVDFELESELRDLVQSMSRSIILAIAAAYVAWHLVSTVMWPSELGHDVLLATPIMVVSVVAALHFVERRPVIAQVIWQLGCAAALTLTLLLFEQPMASFLYGLLPLMAVLSTGWVAGLLVEGFLVVLLTALMLTRPP